MTSKTKQYLKRILEETYNLEKNELDRIIEESTFNELLKEDREFVMHYDVNYWAEEIHEEYIALNF